jgi:hypothetical protein
MLFIRTKTRLARAARNSAYQTGGANLLSQLFPIN